MDKIKGLTVRRLGKESMLVAESPELIDFDRLVTLNDSALYVWESLPQSGFDVETLVRLLADRYEVEEEVARRDSSELLEVWLRAGLVHE